MEGYLFFSYHTLHKIFAKLPYKRGNTAFFLLSLINEQSKPTARLVSNSEGLDRNPWVVHSYPQWSEITGMTGEQVRYAMAALEEFGLIEREHKSYNKGLAVYHVRLTPKAMELVYENAA